jgi:proteic killer suppression protein
MIVSFKHKGIEEFYKTGNKRRIQVKHAKRLRFQMAALDSAHQIEDCNLPSYNLHPLKGNKKHLWAITVNGNWRLTFEFKEGNVHILNDEDYH